MAESYDIKVSPDMEDMEFNELIEFVVYHGTRRVENQDGWGLREVRSVQNHHRQNSVFLSAT